MPATTRTLETMILQAHRAKGIRYPTSSQKQSFKTWYSYALRRGGAGNVEAKGLREYGRQARDLTPSGRTYM
ncbi:hypothetical protein DPSP01_014355 [Paraphaeosphaeria sporulosa]|uniref:Uncharacterized protein n=1 Tax=Paraphaeosphaeria sporulosa TaxID=1460663 RepID=A0A177CBK8_9PLEO|nr:uncharacterized protein CC84DRAFT_1166242 [Paraphaeosphaeria sporulosa]OAG04138.1 hypothetical protein CC84DRAFT_1166242 [Paraphaeosphaeria sporulosa]